MPAEKSENTWPRKLLSGFRNKNNNNNNTLRAGAETERE
jgi:hypothetical protein